MIHRYNRKNEFPAFYPFISFSPFIYENIIQGALVCGAPWSAGPWARAHPARKEDRPRSGQVTSHNKSRLKAFTYRVYTEPKKVYGSIVHVFSKHCCPSFPFFRHEVSLRGRTHLIWRIIDWLVSFSCSFIYLWCLIIGQLLAMTCAGPVMLECNL